MTAANLNPCPSCRWQIAKTAKACPNCGAPNMPAVYKARREALGLIVSIAAIATLIYVFI
jgi:predicted RNA-binding Zn-ribbon protein involved in translation (DUF1610 family)